MIRNLTPHDVIITVEDNCEGLRSDDKTNCMVAKSVIPLTIFKSVGVARFGMKTTPSGTISGLPIKTCETIGSTIEGLPEFKEGTYYIVSLPTIEAARAVQRTLDDLLTPGDIIRSESNQSIILGCLCLLKHK